MIYITSFLKTNINRIQPQDQPPHPKVKSSACHPYPSTISILPNGFRRCKVYQSPSTNTKVKYCLKLYLHSPTHLRRVVKHGNNFTSTIPKDLFNSRTRRFITSSTKVRHLAPSPFIHTLSLRSSPLWMFALTWNRSTIRWTSSP